MLTVCDFQHCLKQFTWNWKPISERQNMSMENLIKNILIPRILNMLSNSLQQVDLKYKNYKS